MDELTSIIADTKRRYGKVFVTQDMGTTFYFRPMTNADIKLLQGMSTSQSRMDIEEALIDSCVIWPLNYDYDKHSAGFVTSLCEEIREYSGFDDQDFFLQMVDQARNDANRVTTLMKALIIAAIPAYKPEDIDNMSLFKQTETLALAERILEIHRVPDPPKLTFQGDKDEKKSQADDVVARLHAQMGKAFQQSGLNPANIDTESIMGHG
jgi:hypothetical protein